jgi:hypothetical protein
VTELAMVSGRTRADLVGVGRACDGSRAEQNKVATDSGGDRADDARLMTASDGSRAE